MDDSGGPDQEVQTSSAPNILAVDEHIDMPTQRTGLVPDPGAELRPRHHRGIQDRPQRQRLTADWHDQLAETVSELTQNSREDDPNALAHGITAARTHRTSGSCEAMRVKLSPSSSEA